MSNNALWGQATHTLTLIGQQNPNQAHIKTLHDGPLTDLLEGIMQGKLPDRDKIREFYGLTPLELRIIVDYAESLEEMIAAGNYDWKNSDITPEHFPILGKGKVELKPHLIHFNRVIDSDDVLKSPEMIGKRPGKIEELLAFGKTYPEMQRKFPVVALGSVAGLDGHRRVACLDEGRSERELYLNWRVDGWDESCRFLAFDE